MKEDKLTEIFANIEESREVLQEAWKNHAPEIAGNMQQLGKSVTDRTLRHQWEISKDVERTNVLKRLKLFWGGSYLTRIKSGETIFADLAYFRNLFLSPPVNQIAIEQSFFRINDLWVSVQKAFFARDRKQVQLLMLPLTQEIFAFRRMLAQSERSMNNESAIKSFFRRIRKLFTR